MDELIDHTKFDVEYPVFLVLSCRAKRQPHAISLLNPDIGTPISRQHGFALIPIFTDNDLAQRFAEQERIADAVLMGIRTDDDLLDVLTQAKAIGRTRVVFDQTRESKRNEMHHIDEVIGAIRKRQR